MRATVTTHADPVPMKAPQAGYVSAGQLVKQRERNAEG